MQLFRATIFHTPENPFLLDISDPRSLVCHQDGGLLIGQGRIVACGEYAAIRDANPGAVTTDWRGGFILPGFVDAHVHFPQTRIIGVMGRTLLDWLEVVALPEEARMADRRYAADTAALFVRALASHGTTTALVFGAHFVDATVELFEAAAASGMRVVSGQVLSDRLLLSALHVTAEQAYRESKMLIERYHKRGRLLYAVTPRFAYSTSESMLEVCQQLMAEYSDVRLQTHINENTAEIGAIARLFPWAADYLAIYERYKLSGVRSVMAHNIHASPAEIDRLADAGTAVAHCPGSNAALGSGCFPLRRHIDAGVTCALGTDVGGGIGFGMMKEGLHAYLMQRLAPDPKVLDAARLLYMTTRAGAEALGLETDIGDFRVGKAADFVYLRPPSGSVLEAAVRRAEASAQSLAALFTLAGSESVREVRVEGDIVFAKEGGSGAETTGSSHANATERGVGLRDEE
jgi:guanine deaminase